MPTAFCSNAGSAQTITIKMPYFTYRSHLSFLVLNFLGNGILLSKSCTQPNGQRKPQTNLPSKVPIKIKMPVM